jgi:hypothetical protein
MRAAVVLAVLFAAGTARAGGGALPPMEIDLGETTTFGGGSESQFLAGIHWASLSWKPTPIEIGVGYIGISRELTQPGIARETMPVSTDTSLRLDGGYLTLGKTLTDRSHIRTWFLVRGELLHGSTESTGFSALGGAARFAAEVYGATAAGGGGSAIVGTFALGFYVEAAHRDVPDAYGPNGLSTGITLRIPLLAAN